jgi:DNA adenine methylase
MKTFLRRPGNKTKHLKHIIPLIPDFPGTYYEPFLGTGAVYLHLLPKKAVLNDLNRDIANIWRLVKKNIIQEIEKFKKKFLHLNNEEKLKLCKEIVSKIDTYEGDTRTVNYLLMIYCSFTGCIILNNRLYIGGLYADIYFSKTCHIFTQNYREKIQQLQKILKNTKISSKDYSEILKDTKSGDFVFLDPPYVEEKNYAFSYNNSEHFNPAELKLEVQKLDKKKVKWMMTQIDTDQVRELFRKYKIHSYTNLGSLRNNGAGKKEVIITNY